jgi:hypothetical protein
MNALLGRVQWVENRHLSMSNIVDPIILNILNKNKQIIQQKFYAKLFETHHEERGFVYGFSKISDNNSVNNYWLKLGRTIRDPNKRVREWNGVMEFYKKTKYNKTCERLIHLLFDYAREHRVSDKGKKQIEWFHFNEHINIIDVVELIIYAVENKNVNNVIIEKKIIQIEPDIEPDIESDIEPDVEPDIESDIEPDIEPDVELENKEKINAEILQPIIEQIIQDIIHTQLKPVIDKLVQNVIQKLKPIVNQHKSLLKNNEQFTVEDLNKYTKIGLIDLCTKLNIFVNKKALRKDLVQVLLQHKK